MKSVVDRYTSGKYFLDNPTWDKEDCPWKARFVNEFIIGTGIVPSSICEIGCGSGNVLAELRSFFPDTELIGYEIAKDASRFWSEHSLKNISFHLGDFINLNERKYDILLLLDVIEHIADPLSYLSRIKDKGRYILLHIPLDLSAINVVRRKPLINLREKVGHIDYFTKDLAISLINEAGYKIIKWKYSVSYLNSPKKSWKTIAMQLPRNIAYFVNKDVGVRMLGGETLWVLLE